MANHATLGHFLPFLLRRRLQAVAWPEANGTRAVSLLLLALMVAYGVGFGALLNNRDSESIQRFLPQMLTALYGGLLVSGLLVDFVPTIRLVTRPLPEHFPVSARQNLVTAFLLDLITLRRLIIVAGLLATLAMAPRHGLVPGFGLLVITATAVLSFNIRVLASLRRWRHPLLALHALSLALMLWWLTHPTANYYTGLGVVMAVLPVALWTAQLYWLGPYFSARYLPLETATPSSQVLSRLPVEWKVYTRKTWMLLSMGLVFKTLMLGATALVFIKNGKLNNQSLFYFSFLPVIGFTYINNNLFGYLSPLVANEVLRLGLTGRLLRLYIRLVGPVVLADCLISAAMLLGMYPRSFWPLLGLLPLGGAPLMSIGLWSSLYKAKEVAATPDFSSIRKGTSALMSFVTIGVALALYFMPWWWARILLASLVTASAVWPVRAMLRNDGELRRSLWRGIGA